MEPFRQEVQKAIAHLKCGMSIDEAGVCAELVKNGGQCLWDMILDLFNEIA